MKIRYISANVRPGIKAPMKRLPTETCMISAIIINIILGGIRIPNVPDAAITPVARAWLYFCLIIGGNAKAVIIVTDAPIIPVIAARTVPITVTDIARPPGTFLNKICVVFNKSFAIPLLSIIVPINTKLGIATNIRFSAEKPHILGTKLKNSASLNTPNRYPIKP